MIGWFCVDSLVVDCLWYLLVAECAATLICVDMVGLLLIVHCGVVLCFGWI